jgi:Leucine-rich repeat (LRR) protein
MGTTPEKVVTMYLDEKFKSATVEGELLAKCENLKTLSCASCGLTTLAGFPALANLKDLSLNDNRIADGLEALVGCKALSSLSLANNKLANVDDLKAVAEELTLSVLELEANPLTENEDYHEKVMTMMPTLNVLDGRDEFGNEIEDDDEDDDEDEDDEDDEDEDEDDDEDDEDADEDEDESEEEEEEEEEEMA